MPIAVPRTDRTSLGTARGPTASRLGPGDPSIRHVKAFQYGLAQQADAGAAESILAPGIQLGDCRLHGSLVGNEMKDFNQVQLLVHILVEEVLPRIHVPPIGQ